MYGSVAMLKIKPGMRAEFARQMEEVGQSVEFVSGFISSHLYYLDDDPNGAILTIVYDSEESYRQSAEMPETHENYLKWRAYLTEDPVWHDGRTVPFLRFR
jgi:heme-degrading monooxygenase HmoA